MMAEEEHNYTPEISPAKSSENVEKRKFQPGENLLKWMEITVSEPEKRTGISMKMQETFMVYLVETKTSDPDAPEFGEGPTSLWRRYSEFELLRNYLDVTYPAIIVPVLPEKRVSHVWQGISTDKFDPDFIERRRQGLENFVLRVAAHPVLSQDEMFAGFLTQAENWKETIYATEFQSKADSKIKAYIGSFQLKKPDRRFEELKNYSNELKTNINNILRIRAKLADRQYGIHKIHANYGRVFSEWSGLEKDMGDGLQSAGHFMDVYASSIDAMLEDEEQFADQLKEYYAFSESLRSVCRKQEHIQLDLERLENELSYIAQQKEQLNQSKAAFSLSSMRTRLFGSDTPEQKEVKLAQLEEDLKRTETQLKTQTAEAQEFVEAALKDIERFKRQKVKDMKEIFTNYAIMQIERCKKGMQVWQSTKDCFHKI